MLSTSAESATRTRWWLTAVVVGAGYGVFLIIAALRLPAGAALTGQFWAQPAVKALMAVLLAVAALAHPIARERRWLLGALLFSAAGDFLLAIPWWQPSFVGGLSAFLLAHLCFLGALVPLAAPTRARVAVALVVVAACVGLLVWFWPPAVRRQADDPGDGLHDGARGHGVRGSAGPACRRRGRRSARCASRCRTP